MRKYLELLRWVIVDDNVTIHAGARPRSFRPRTGSLTLAHHFGGRIENNTVDNAFYVSFAPETFLGKRTATITGCGRKLALKTSPDIVVLIVYDVPPWGQFVREPIFATNVALLPTDNLTSGAGTLVVCIMTISTNPGSNARAASRNSNRTDRPCVSGATAVFTFGFEHLLTKTIE